GPEEAAADAHVVTDGIRELGDVGAGDFGDLGHGVDERDLRGEEGVRRHLHELGGRVVGDDERRLVRYGRVVHLAQHVGRIDTRVGRVAANRNSAGRVAANLNSAGRVAANLNSAGR